MKRLTGTACDFCNTVLEYPNEEGLMVTRLIAVEYPHDHPDHYDGVSEWRCPYCGVRVGRWSERVLAFGETEPRWGKPRLDTGR